MFITYLSALTFASIFRFSYHWYGIILLRTYIHIFLRYSTFPIENGSVAFIVCLKEHTRYFNHVSMVVFWKCQSIFSYENKFSISKQIYKSSLVTLAAILKLQDVNSCKSKTDNNSFFRYLKTHNYSGDRERENGNQNSNQFNKI